MTERTFAQKLAAEVPRAAGSPIGEEERQQALLCLIDSIACGLAVHDEPLIRKLADVPDAGPYLVLGNRSIADPDLAVLANAAAIRSLDFNDVHSGRNNLHPSEMVIPLILAYAQRESWAGDRVLDTVAICYRLNLWIGEVWEGLLGRGWAPTATTGAVAGAAISSVLEGLDVERTAHALSLAALTSPSLGVVFRGQLSDGKSIINGLAVLAGQQAALLAGRGVTGPANAFEGPAGYNEMVGGTPTEDRIGAWKDLGAHVVWRKRYPSVFHAHAAIDAAIAARADLDDVEAIDRVEISVSEKVAQVAATPERWHPATPEDAQFSLPYGVATAIVYGDCTIDHFQREILEDETVRALMAKTTVTASDEWATYVGGAVTIRVDGREVAGTVEFPTGHPNSPMTSQAVVDKAVSLVDRFCPGEAEPLIDLLLGLGQIDDLSDIFAALERSR